MKAKKKPKGTKARVQAYKKRLSYIATVTTVAVLVAIIAISGFLISSFLSPSPQQNINPDQTSNQASPAKAAIVDQLGLTAPNQTFVQTATNTLKHAGYTVDYYSAEEVTVDFYRNLPTQGHSIVILRAHSTATKPDRTEGPVMLFTSEPYDRTRYVYEQVTDQLVIAASEEEWERGIGYFGIYPPFVAQSMKGRFQNTIIIMMGCEGLDNPSMAKAFVNKGATAYISWNQGVLASYIDLATTQLLKHLVTENQTIKQAVTETMKEVGRDPAYKSLLVYYPLEAGNQTIEDITSTQTSHSFFGGFKTHYSRAPLVSLRFLLAE